MVLRAQQAVRIRRLTRADRDKIRSGFELLGQRTLHQRFGRVVQDARRTLAWVEALDDTGDIAVGACAWPSGEPVGLARYVGSTATSAEVAVTVVDAWQGRGVGGALLRELCRQAQQRGLTTLTAAIFFENRRAVGLLRSIGGVRSGPGDGGLTQYVIGLEPERQARSAAAAAHRAHRVVPLV